MLSKTITLLSMVILLLISRKMMKLLELQVFHLISQRGSQVFIGRTTIVSRILLVLATFFVGKKVHKNLLKPLSKLKSNA